MIGRLINNLKLLLDKAPTETNGHLCVSEHNEKKTLATKKCKISKQTQHGTIEGDERFKGAVQDVQWTRG